MYTVERRETIRLNGAAITLRSLPATVTIDRHGDIFPPAIPTGLVALSIENSGTAGSGTQHSSAEVNLSWQPNSEPDLDGYFVYRRDPGIAGQPKRLTPAPIAALSFDDLSATTPALYRYSVSAVNTSGKESARSPEVSSR